MPFCPKKQRHISTKRGINAGHTMLGGNCRFELKFLKPPAGCWLVCVLGLKNRKIETQTSEELFEKNAIPAVERIGKNWVGRESLMSWIKLTNKRTFSFSGSYCFGRMVAAVWFDHAEIQRDLITLTQEQETYQLGTWLLMPWRVVLKSPQKLY